MKRLFAAMSPRWQRLLEFAAQSTLIVIFASAPFLLNLIGHAICWIIELFIHPDEVWKECPLCL